LSTISNEGRGITKRKHKPKQHKPKQHKPKQHKPKQHKPKQHKPTVPKKEKDTPVPVSWEELSD
jgi:hypothetical protein